jgi:thiosulfate dehydrogenase
MNFFGQLRNGRMFAALAITLLMGMTSTALLLHADPSPGTATRDSGQPASSPAGDQPASADIVALGRRFFHDTPLEAKAYVSNRMSCNNCHFQDGTTPYASPLIGIADIFPWFSERANRKITLKERIQECFVRSENGRPLPEGGKEMAAVVAYINSLTWQGPKGQFPGRGLVKVPALKGDPKKSADIYAEKCAVCHGANGDGVGPMPPPVWGASSFNDGAGMHRVEKMAAFVVKNMPQTNPGTLTPQQAFDVSAYIHNQPRPKYNPKYDKY